MRVWLKKSLLWRPSKRACLGFLLRECLPWLSSFLTRVPYTVQEELETGRDALYADPTHDEMKALRETELLFKSSLMQLQINEVRRWCLVEAQPTLRRRCLENKAYVLRGTWGTDASLNILHGSKSADLTTPPEQVKKEASVNYVKLSSLEAWLHSLKASLQSAPATDVPSSVLPEGTNPPPAFESFEFQPPKAMHIVGSYLLHTVTKPHLTVDVAVEIPIECLHHKDFLNHKYLHKRAMYLECLKGHLESLEIVETVSNKQ